MLSHKLQITYNEASGELTVVHRCSLVSGKETVSHAEDIELTDAEGTVASLQALLEANRKEMENRTKEVALDHLAAVNKQRRKGQKSADLGGVLGPVGNANTEGED